MLVRVHVEKASRLAILEPVGLDGFLVSAVKLKAGTMGLPTTMLRSIMVTNIGADFHRGYLSL